MQDLYSKPDRERFFYRDLSGGWTERDDEVPLKNILLCSAGSNATATAASDASATSAENAASRTTKCFCHLHKAFETAQIKDGKVIFNCGAVAAKGMAVPFVESPDEILEVKRKMSKFPADYRKEIFSFDEEEEIKKKHEYKILKSQADQFEEEYLFPKGELPLDVFALKMSESGEHDKFCLTVTEFAREKFYDNLPFRLNENFVRRTYFTFDIGHFKEKLFGLNNIPLLFEKYKLPSNVQEVLLDSVRRGINKIAGKELQFHTTLTGMELLNAASFFPYEPNVYQLLKYYFCDDYKKILQTISPHDTDLVKQICNFYGVKPYRTLRKLFVEEPAVLYFYIKFSECSFRDKNFFNNLFKEIKSLDLSKKFSEIEKQDCKITNDETMHLDNSNIHHDLWKKRNSFSKNMTSGLNIFYKIFLHTFYDRHNTYDIDSLNFFCKASVPLRGEKATYLALTRDKTIDEWTACDTLRMFEQAYSYLSERERNKILNEGVTQYNHDMLAKIINHNKNKNVDFNMEKWQLKLEDNIDGYSFTLPKDYYALRDLGSTMSNCVASYKDKVLAQKSTIVSAAKDGVFCACIEIVDKNRVVQKLGEYNKTLNGDVADAVAKWMKKHKLVDDTRRYGW